MKQKNILNFANYGKRMVAYLNVNERRQKPLP